MSFNVSGLTAYIENRDFPLIGEIQLSPELRATKGTIQNGVKGSSKMHFLETDVVFGAASCERTEAGTTTFTDKIITVGKIDISESLCLQDLEGYWTQTMLKIGAMEGRQVLPEEIAAVYFEQKKAKLLQELAKADWQGDTALSGTTNLKFYDGWIKIIDAGSPVTGNTASLASITVANIIQAVDNMILAMPTNLMYRNDLYLDMPIEWFMLYKVALKNANYFHLPTENSNPMEMAVYGSNVIARADYGLAGTNRMFLTFAANLATALDAETDGEFEARIDPVTNKKIFIDAGCKRGHQVAFVSQVVEFSL